MKRYMYEEAERRLDAYAITRRAESKKGAKAFYRAYRKFKCLVGIYAYMDFEGEPARKDTWDSPESKQRLSWAWEDVDVAFRGFGENILTGALLQMWDHTHGAEQNRFHEVITEALRAADEATDPTVVRRYLAKVRSRPVRKGSEDFRLPVELPAYGPRLREWAEDEGFDGEALEMQFEMLAEMEAMTRLVEEEPVPAPKLTLIPGGRE